MEIIWQDSALDGLERPREYVSERNASAAERLLTAVFAAVDRLANMPRMGRHGGVPGTRELMVSGTPYIVVYAVAQGALTILAVQHGAQQWPESFDLC